MGSEIVGSDLLGLLDQGKYVEALKLVIDHSNTEVVEKKKKSSLAQRKAAIAEAVKAYDVEFLVHIQTVMQGYVDHVARPDVDEPRQLTQAEATDLMREYLERKDLEEFLKARYDSIRELVFMSIDEANRAKGLDPAASNGVYRVPALGKEFRKQGAGHKAPDLDQKKLRKLLGDDAEDLWEKKVIPEQTVEVLNEERLMRLAQSKPEVMEKIREALIPGGYKTATFRVYDITDDGAED